MRILLTDRRTKTTLANGSTVNYAYDNASQLSSITYKKADGVTVIGDLIYTYDAAGRRVTTSGSLAAINLPNTVASALYNANNQLTSWGGTTYTYDFNGNLTNDGGLTYTWDARNQLASLSGTATASFAYDGVGRRIGKTVGAATTGYVYDGMDLSKNRTFLFQLTDTEAANNKTELAIANLIFALLLLEEHGYVVSSGSTRGQFLGIQDGVVYFCSRDKSNSDAERLLRTFEREPQILPDWVMEIIVQDQEKP